MAIFEILMCVSIFTVAAAIDGIFRARRKKAETRRMIDEFERRYPVKEKSKK